VRRSLFHTGRSRFETGYSILVWYLSELLMRSRLLFLYLCICACVLSNAQSRYRFYTLGTEQGLTSDYAWSVCKDKYNQIWIGTNEGLNRYDGHVIKKYLHDRKDTFSIPGNTIYWIHKDNEGDVWFCFGWDGLARYNYAKDRFEKFLPFDSIKKKNRYSAPLWRINSDRQGRIYFACGGALFRYTKGLNKMEDLTPLFKGKIDGVGIGMIIPQDEKALWIATGNGLFKYDLVQNTIRQIPFDADKMGFGLPVMHDGEFINHHDMLISTVRTGFVLFDTRTEQFRMPPPPIDPTHSKLFSETGSVLKDSKGRIWLANTRYGLLEYLPATNSINLLKNEKSYPYRHAEEEGHGTNIYEDDEGNIWYCSSLKGVTWFKPETNFIEVYQREFSNPASLPYNSVTFFHSADRNKMLIGTNNGLTEFDIKAKQFNNFPIALKDDDIFPANNLRCITQTGDSVFISTIRGLSVLNLQTRKFSRYIHTNSFDSVFSNGIWLMHHYAGKLILSGWHFGRFDLHTKQYEYSGSESKDELYQMTDLNATFLDEQTHTLWLEADIGRLYSYDLLKKKITHHPFTSDSIAMIDVIKKDSDGKIWIGSTGGLYCYDPQTKQATKIQLITSGKQIYNLLIQDNTYLWLSTPTEIIKYNKKDQTTEILASSSFLPRSYIMKRAFLLDTDGFLWVGTNKGFAIIDTKHFHEQGASDEPQLTNFFVFDKQKKFDKALSDIEIIQLGYKENFFSFAVSGFNYQNQNTVEYRYMLDGFDKDWQTANGNIASYTNVPPGTYYLKIKSNTGAGGWIEKRKAIVIKIKSPFWQTWWFITLISLALLSLFLFMYRFNRKRKQTKRIDDTIDYFANSLYGENSVNEICWDIARNCISHLKLEDCVVYLLDKKRDILVQKAAYGPKNPKDHEIVNPIEIKIGEGIVGVAAATAKPVLVKDTTKDKRYIVDDQQRLSELAIPIIHEGKSIGVIDSENSKKGFFNEGHVKALSTIAAISAVKIAEAEAAEAAKASQLQLLEIKKMLAESQLMALRAQMNPHFVFNCLNSIQECIVTEKYGEASLYLNKFSKLFRSVLNNSGKVMITLAEEIEVLELYLSLEHMRFERSFEYKITVDKGLETEEILIPSMLMQPYVENALWHGLMHKQSDRKLDIEFKKLNEEIFQCTVDDNGIGRKKAFQIKEQQGNTKRHVSRGMSISKDRLDLLQKQGQHASLEIIDKNDNSGQASGTKVAIELSTYLKASL
jgi:ligand-binding sensor domain-containing protein/putative methionine-R-sulfoxide reductase with GAF domain